MRYDTSNESLHRLQRKMMLFSESSRFLSYIFPVTLSEGHLLEVIQKNVYSFLHELYFHGDQTCLNRSGH